ncbi:MAG: multidrug resistance protein D [Methanomassiliicoccales archaeon PtaB.Bin215]|nr:MAG: multidrug resistance protein D [Methanomassiliicoccales archaeon PtaB.Bin215]
MITMKRLFTGISTNVLVLGLVSLLTDVSSEMIYPILPLFLVGIGATGAVIGLIEGAAETTASLLKVVSGRLSDRFGKRKPFLTSGYGLSTLAKPLLFLATSYWHVFAVRVTERVGKGLRSAPRDALIADSTPREHIGKAYGLHKAMDSTGAVIGPLLVLPMLFAAATVTTDTYRQVFILATIPAALAVLVLFIFVKEPPNKAPRANGRMLKDARRLGRRFWALTLVVLIFFAGEISYSFFVLQSQAQGMSTVTTILLYALFNVIFVIVSLPSGVLSDRVGRRPVLIVSFVLFAMTSLVMASATGLVLLAIGFALYGVYKGTSEGAFKAFVIDLVPKDLRGTALGVYHTAVGLVMLPGGLVAGLLWDAAGPWGTFGYGIAMSLVALALMLYLTRRGGHVTASPGAPGPP